MHFPDVIKVPVVGAAGGLTSQVLAKLPTSDLTLAELATLGSIVVSSATTVWVLMKCYYLVKNKGKSSE